MDSLLTSPELPERPRRSRQRRPVRGFLLMLIGRQLHFLGAMLLFLGLVGSALVLRSFLKGADKFGEQDIGAAMRAAGMSVTIAFMLYRGGLTCYQRGKKFRARCAADELRRDKRAPVLYLRAFRSDLLGTRNIDHRDAFLAPLSPRQLIAPPLTEEEQVARAFRRLGPFITIGNPDDGDTVLGASRHYVAQEKWQECVIDTIRRAQLVVVRIGTREVVRDLTFMVLDVKTTPGLTWELLTSTSKLAPGHLVLLVGCDESEYVACKMEVEKAFPKGLPEFHASAYSCGTIRGVIVFSDDWSPRFLPVTRRDVSPFRLALYPLVSAIADKVNVRLRIETEGATKNGLPLCHRSGSS